MNIFDKTGNIATIAINQLIRSNVRQSLSLNCICCKFFSITLTTLLTFFHHPHHAFNFYYIISKKAVIVNYYIKKAVIVNIAEKKQLFSFCHPHRL